MKKKKNWTAEQKLQIVVCALKGEDTVEAICKKFGVAPSQVHAWKKQFLENGATIFGNKKSVDQGKDYQQELSRLYEKIGQLTMERDFLKKSYGHVQWRSDDA